MEKEPGGKKFTYATTVTIGDTNLLQNMYFSNFFRIQGIVRELWVSQAVEDPMQPIKDGMVLITKSAHCDYYKDFYLYDKIYVVMQIKKLRNASAELEFKFFNADTNTLHAEGYQQIVFAGPDHKICRIPDNYLRAALEYSKRN
jgi:acyl-CoA thioesterase FadM